MHSCTCSLPGFLLVSSHDFPLFFNARDVTSLKYSVIDFMTSFKESLKNTKQKSQEKILKMLSSVGC